MRINRFCFSLIVSLSMLSNTIVAQINSETNLPRKDSLLNEITDINKRLKEYSVKDTTSGYSIRQLLDSIEGKNVTPYVPGTHIQPNFEQRDTNGLLIVQNQWSPFKDNVSFEDTIIFDPSFLPVIFDGRILPQDLNFISKDTINQRVPYHLIDPDSTFAPQLARIDKIQNMRRAYYMNYPLKIKLNRFAFSDAPVINKEVVEKRNIFNELLTTDDAINYVTPEVEKIEIKKVYWIKNGEHTVEISQNQFTDNWNGTGGDNNLSLRNEHRINLNYKKGKIRFDNTFEWRLSLLQTPADTMHNINVLEDMVRVYSVLGLDAAFKKWSYTVKLEMRTPLFNNYPLNSPHKREALFSPLIIRTGIGMSYNLEKVSPTDKHRKTKLSADISPLAVNYTFVGDKGVDETRFAIDEGKKANTEFGSTFNVVLDYSFNRFTKLYSRFNYFTTYDRVIAESENRLSFDVSRYFTTSINLFMRFDDGIGVDSKVDGWGYFQYNHRLGFGLKYKW
ncbi:DUF3078 domain-containing protein [Dysgonomonas sp. ZJ709]|uniref:DUF3078 domain-containing protein n=1 Tax=Dysgonomonas sp. ZJ709 TaxID=2709797 RepID=UPI0013ED04B0|nr:DUF3078 domain-containing protein [Dysgonomonas sp. ZJ709]